MLIFTFNRVYLLCKKFIQQVHLNWQTVLETKLKLRCDSRFQRALTACSCVFKVITLIGSNQGNFFENATTCRKRVRKVCFVVRNITVTDSESFLSLPFMPFHDFPVSTILRNMSNKKTVNTS